MYQQVGFFNTSNKVIEGKLIKVNAKTIIMQVIGLNGALKDVRRPIRDLALNTPYDRSNKKYYRAVFKSINRQIKKLIKFGGN